MPIHHFQSELDDHEKRRCAGCGYLHHIDYYIAPEKRPQNAPWPLASPPKECLCNWHGCREDADAYRTSVWTVSYTHLTLPTILLV